MGKKRRSQEHKRNPQTESQSFYKEDGDDDGNTMSLTIFSVMIISCVVLGFSLGARPSPNLNMSIAEWTSASLSHIGMNLHNLGQSISHRFLFSSSGDDMYNVPFSYVNVNGRRVRDDASHPLVFAALREAIIREDGGVVHPDLGFLVPAPSGATRGIGFVRDTYHTCQTRCMPGSGRDKIAARDQNINKEGHEHAHKQSNLSKYPPFWDAPIDQLDTSEKLKNVLDQQQGAGVEEKYFQEEMLIKVPLSYQMTRRMALQTLTSLLPPDVHQRAPIHELDDAALLVLLLAHERGLGKKSKFHPYIATLPIQPSCGYSPAMRNQALQTIDLMGIELGMDVVGWPVEISKASDRAQMIADGLTKDYGAYIATPAGTSTFSVIQWSLCQVASRGTAGSEEYGALRLVPMADMVNHDVDTGGFIELNGKERLQNDHLLDADEKDAGAFVVRSIRHGRRRPLKLGQELLVDYHVPSYSPLDWFLSLGFVPPERMVKWAKTSAHFQKERTFSDR